MQCIQQLRQWIIFEVLYIIKITVKKAEKSKKGAHERHLRRQQK